MKRVLIGVFIVMVFFLLAGKSFAVTEPSVVITPSQIEQGDPFMIKVMNVQKVSDIKSVTFIGKKSGVFMYQSVPTALAAVDFMQKPGTYTVTVVMKSGKTIKQSVVIASRQTVQETLGIPAQLGGNTPTGQKNVLNDIAKEKDVFNTIKTNKTALWIKPFIFPVTDPVVTDPYGVIRQTGTATIAHKGTDFKAAEGTPILAMNNGIVRMAQSSSTYGKTVVIDHGQGIATFYLHLSSYQVKPGQTVQQGQVIGLSGQTGYAVGPHLHLTVRINNISIDPMKFMALFQN